MKKILISFVSLLMSFGALAQNLNPVVEVTNVYEREASGIEKPSQLLALPDSVFRFNLDFDYSVRTTPYQGAYEFKPYLVQLHPQARPLQEGTLYVSGGAGYGFHPELTAVWTPLRRDNLRVSLYGDTRSYMGYYRNLVLREKEVVSDGLQDNGGCESRSAVGANLLLNWTSGAFLADIGYKNVLGTDSFGQFSHNILQFQGRVKGQGSEAFSYEAGTRVAYLGVLDFRETHTVSDVGIGTRFAGQFLKLGIRAETVSHRADYYGNIAFTPRYLFSLGDFRFDLGVKLSFLYRSADDICPHKPGYVFPDVRIAWDAVPETLTVQAAVTGGDHLQSYESLLGRNAFLGSTYWCEKSPFRLDNSVERVNASLGVRGNVAERFHYDLKAGYQLYQNAFTWGFPTDDTLVPVTGYLTGSLHTFYASLDAGWKSERIDAGAQLYYGYTLVPDLVTAEELHLFAPAPFGAKGHFQYNWGGRIRAGVDVDARSAQKSRNATLPAYADLGLSGDLQMTRMLGFWLRVGNLLNQSVQRVPFHAERGIYFTVGARLNF